ncbi:7-cyano-7-deazaguanine synthase [bacterium]|nr:7-cyano-7-deazaguanine synthase [bacterium]
MINKKAILLYSGGIDSTILHYWLLKKNYDIYHLFINYGQKSYEGEQKAIHNILDKKFKDRLYELNIKNMGTIGSGTLIGEFPEKDYIRSEWYQKECFPNRNLLLLTLASNYGYRKDIYEIAIGVIGKESYYDTKKEYVSAIEKLLNKGDRKFKIIAPFMEKDREEVIANITTKDIPYKKTFSCNSIGSHHCMLCTSCEDRVNTLKLIE